MSDRPYGEPPDAEQLVSLARHDDEWRETLDRVCALACQLLKVPIAQVNVVGPEKQISISSVGEGDYAAAWTGWREVDVTRSFCQHVVARGERLVIDDARAHPLVKENLSTLEGGVRAYLGVPVKNRRGSTVATLCVVDFDSRSWGAEQVAALSALADFVMREVADRIEAEKALAEGESRFGSMIENVNDLITILDDRGDIAFLGPAYERLFGFDREALRGRPFTDLVHPDDVASWRERVMGPLMNPGHRVTSGEWRMRDNSGRWKVVEGTAVNLVEDPAVGGFVLNVLDVTYNRQLQDELLRAQRMEALGKLAAAVAHDFNNVLTVANSAAEFLGEERKLSEEARSAVADLASATRSGMALVKQLLRFGRAEGAAEEHSDVGKVIDELKPMLARLLGRHVDLKVVASHGLPPVRVPRSSLEQVLMNLVVNARDAMPEGGEVRVETRHSIEDDGTGRSHVLLSVADTGVGIEPSVLTRIFDPFFTTKGDRGTGLGLGTVWRIATDCGGRVEVESKLGVGTRFTVALPAGG